MNEDDRRPRRKPSTDYTSEKDFLGIINKWCYQKYIERRMALLSGKLIGTIDIKDKPIIIDDLLAEKFIDFDNNLTSLMPYFG